jgi:filamentous hemagglutinin
VVADSLLVKQSIDNALGQDIPLKMVYDLTALWSHQLDAEGAVSSTQFAQELTEKYGIDGNTAVAVGSALASAISGLPAKSTKGTGVASERGAVSLPNGLSIAQFEKGLAILPAGERVAQIKDMASKVAFTNNLVKSNKLSKLNNRDVYEGHDGNLYALDTQHGIFEVINPKNGKHLGEVDFEFNQKKPADKSGGHDLRVK